MNLSIHSEHQLQVTIVIMIDLLILAALHCNPVYTLYTIQEHNIFMFVHTVAHVLTLYYAGQILYWLILYWTSFISFV